MSNVLIAITTYNQAEYTEKCFESLRQTQAKVICIDDASMDHTREVCRKYGIDFITRKSPRGLTYSWNYAYKYFLEHDFGSLIISNNDILFPAGIVKNIVGLLGMNPSVSVMSRRNEGGCWADIFAVETYHQLESSFVDVPENYQKVQDWVSNHPQSSRAVDKLSGFCFGINRKIVEYEFAPGILFNPANINVGQEQDLISRCRESMLCLQAFVFHWKGVSFKRGNQRVMDNSRNNLTLYHNTPYLLLLRHLKRIINKCRSIFK